MSRQPDSEPPVRMTVRQNLAWLAEYWRPHRTFALVLVFWTLLSSAVAVAFPLVWKEVIDGLAALEPGVAIPTNDLWLFTAILVAIAVGRVVVGLYPAFRAWMNLNIERAVRARVFGSILTKDHAFLGRFRTGDLVTRLTDDITEYPRIAWFGCSGIFRFLDSFARVFFCVGAMLLYCDVELALLAMLPVPVMLWVFYLARNALRATYAEQQNAVSRTNDTLEAALSGIRIVKAFNADRGQEQRLAAILTERVSIQWRLAKLVALVHQSDNVASRVGQVVVLSVGGLRVLDGTLGIGTLLALHLYLEMLIHPMMDLPNLFVAARQAFVSIEREEEVLRAPAAARTASPDQPELPVDRVRVDAVTFRHRDDVPAALLDVSFTVEGGERVAVVGPVAAGKSTLLRVLAGLLRPASGRVEYGGRPAEDWDWPTLRQRIGYVPQESLLFSDTIAANVAFGREAPESWVRECLSAAQMDDDLQRVEGGIEARLGRGGSLVSGGQKQRVAIARALAGRPELLLLDDCTSSLDARNEDRLWDAVARISPGATVFVVSHRLATIRRADRILVLDGGRLVGDGSHHELARSCAVYQEFLVTEERRRHLESELAAAESDDEAEPDRT